MSPPPSLRSPGLPVCLQGHVHGILLKSESKKNPVLESDHRILLRIKGKELWVHGEPWMNLKGIRNSEKREPISEITSCMIPFI